MCQAFERRRQKDTTISQRQAGAGRQLVGLTDLGNNLDLGDVLGTAGSAHVIRVDALVKLGGIGRAAFVLGQVRTHALTVLLHPSHLDL